MNALWRYVEGWAGREPAAANPERLEASLEATWQVSPALLAAFVLVVVAVLLTVYWHERSSGHKWWKLGLAAIRSTLVGLVVFMLLGWTLQRHRTDLPNLAVVLDDSESMGLVDPLDDNSQSAEIKRRLARTRLAEPTRLNLGKSLLLPDGGALAGELARRYQVRWYLAGSSARALGQQDVLAAIEQLSPQQPSSRLGDCLTDVLQQERGRSVTALVLLTDGITTDGRSLAEAARSARAQSVPLFLIGLGNDRPLRDVNLADVLVDQAAFVGDLVCFDAKIVAEGYTGKATLRLLVAEAPPEQQPIDLPPANSAATPKLLEQQELQLDAQTKTHTVRLAHRVNAPGEFDFTIEVVPSTPESNTQNNRVTRRVIVRQEKISVLLAQAYPSYEFRFLKQMLARELNPPETTDGNSPGVRTLLQEADPAYSDTDKSALRSFPVTRDELFPYDVLILGDLNPDLLSPSMATNIRDFVTARGGGLIVIAGPRYTPLAWRGSPLAALFPCPVDAVRLPDAQATITESFRPRLTPLGMASPPMQLADSPQQNAKLWRDELTPLHWLAALQDLRPGVRVLAEHPSLHQPGGQPLPVITMQFVGAGKVVFHATDETYRWRFGGGDAHFARYWVQTIRYLCRSRLLGGGAPVELTTDRNEYRRGDPVELRVRFLDERQAPPQDNGVTVALERSGGQRRDIVLHRRAEERGVFEGTASGLVAGQYRALVALPTQQGSAVTHEFTIVEPPGELAQTQMKSAELQEAARISGGKFYGFMAAQNLLSDLPRGRHLRLESLPPRPIWNSPILASLFVLLITGEWLLRRRLGML